MGTFAPAKAPTDAAAETAFLRSARSDDIDKVRSLSFNAKFFQMICDPIYIHSIFALSVTAFGGATSPKGRGKKWCGSDHAPERANLALPPGELSAKLTERENRYSHCVCGFPEFVAMTLDKLQ